MGGAENTNTLLCYITVNKDQYLLGVVGGSHSNIAGSLSQVLSARQVAILTPAGRNPSLHMKVI